MCDVLERAEKKGIEIALEEGRKKDRERIIRAYKKGYSVEFIAEFLELSIEQVQSCLKLINSNSI